MRLLVADDEPLARARLRRMLAACPSWHCVGETGDAIATVDACRRLAPDAVLLDIELAGGNGLDVAAALRDQQPAPAVIFVTAHEEHAIEAFNLAATHYLLKPVTLEQLSAALGRIAAGRPAALQERTHTHVRVQLRGRVEWVAAADVLYFEADHKYVTAYTQEREHLLEDSLVSLEQRFGEQFLRIHRKLLVNRAAVRALARSPDGRWSVELAGGQRLPVSRRCVGTLRALGALAGEISEVTLKPVAGRG